MIGKLRRQSIIIIRRSIRVEDKLKMTFLRRWKEEKKRRKGYSPPKMDNVYSFEKLVLTHHTTRCRDPGY
jgi:hypothetical protein